MKEKNLRRASPYKNNLLASRGKSFLTSLAEVAMVFIFSFFFYVALAYPITNSLPAVKEAEASYRLEEEELNAISEEIRLKVRDGDGYLSSEAMARDYVKTLTKTSFFLNGEAYPAIRESVEVNRGETFLNKGEDSSYPLDNISYYFYTLKAKEGSISSYVYDGVDYSSDKEVCLYQKFFAYEDVSIFSQESFELPLYQQLSLDKAKLLADYIVYGGSSSSLSGSLYNQMIDHYLKAYSKIVEEVESNYAPYVTVFSSFDAHYSLTVAAHLIGFSASFLLGWAVNELILPIFFKNHRTLSMKMMRVAYSCHDESEATWWNALIKSLVRIPLYFSTIFVMMSFLGIQTLSLYSFSGFRFISLLGISFVGLLVSAILELILPTRQALGELAGGLILKDLDYYEAGEAAESLPIEKGVDDGKGKN